MNTWSKTVLQAILFVLLFTMQGLCHAHQLDHIVSGDNTPCSVCSAGGQLQSTIVDTTPISAPELQVFSETLFLAPAPSATVHSSQSARAPPLSP